MDKRKKSYYPEGQIQKGLYTNGKEWMLVDGTEYIGDYHRYPTTGEVFTKSSYIRTISKKLIVYVDLAVGAKKQAFQYDNIKIGTISSLLPIRYEKQNPKESDYVNGYFFRYFVKRHFQDIISEVSKDSYSQADVTFFTKLKLGWKLTGLLNDSEYGKGVYDTNRRLVLRAEQAVKGIAGYITDYTEFARIEQRFENIKDNSNIIINEGLAISNAYIGDGEIPQSQQQVVPFVPDPGLIFIPNGALVTQDGTALVTNQGEIIVTG